MTPNTSAELHELARARKVLADAINLMPLTTGQKFSLIAAAGSLEKAAATAAQGASNGQ